MTYSENVIAKAGGNDWSLFSFDGGAALVDGVAVLDGANDALSANLTLDYAGKSVWAVVRTNVADFGRDTALQLNAGTAATMVGVQARTAGTFKAMMRTPGAAYGYGSSLVYSVNVAEAETNDLGRWVLIGMIFDEDGKVYVVNGTDGIGATARPVSVPMTRIVIGRDTGTTGFIGMECASVTVLDVTGGEALEAFLIDMRDRFLVPVPHLTPLKNSMFAVMGDSNAVGVKASAPEKRFAYQAAQSFLADMTNYAIAGGQISPVGLTDVNKLALCGARVMTPGRLAGKSAVIVFGGSNDWGGADGVVPVGLLGDTTEATFHGSLDLMINGFLANSVPGTLLYIGTTVNTSVTVQNTTGATVLDFDAAIRDRIAADTSGLIRLFDARTLGLTAEDFATDGYHLNDQGHAKVGEFATAQVALEYGIVR